jgi:phosphatidylglycerophosphate synthase
MIEGLPILISSFRIAIVPVLWVFAALNWQQALALGLFFAVLSDWLDGQVGRWLKHDSEQESRIDSLADKILTLSVLLWLVWLHPQIVSENLILVGFVLLLGIISWGVGLWRHGSVLGLHLRFAKYAGLVQALFVLSTFWFRRYTPWLLYAAAGTWCIAACEEILVQWKHSHINRYTKTIFRDPKP